MTNTSYRKTSVVDPDLEDFGPTGSGSVIICTDPDSDLDLDLSIIMQKKVRKTLISTVL
jgi:hypothetical protein